MTDIVKVWGTADEYDIVLSYVEGTQWQCSLPPDLTDGQYAVQLFAMRENGLIGIWTGILYICDGIRCLHLNQDPFTFWLCPERLGLELTEECTHGK